MLVSGMCVSEMYACQKIFHLTAVCFILLVSNIVSLFKKKNYVRVLFLPGVVSPVWPGLDKNAD